MKRHSRLLSFAVMVVVIGGAAAYMTLSSDASKVGQQPLPDANSQIEAQIASGAIAPKDCRPYGDSFLAKQQYASAGKAYEKYLIADPSNREVRLACARAWALSNDADGLYDFLRDCYVDDPKFTLQLFDQPEAHRYLADTRFSTLQNQSRVAAMD